MGPMMGKARGAAAVLVLLSVISVALAQSRRVSQPAAEQLHRALAEGRYDEVAGLAERLDPQDPSVAALVARASIARGRYDSALAALQPIAQRAPTSDAALEYGLLLQRLGRVEAQAVLSRVASLAEVRAESLELARAAHALRALGRAQEANAAYRDASAAAPRDPAIHTAWGDLFLEKYQNGEALKSYQAALGLDARWAPALIGSARAVADEDSAQAATLAAKALEINPSSVDTHVFLADEAIDSGRRDDAHKSLQKALAVNPSSLEALSLFSGLLYLEDKPAEFEASVANILKISPRYGEVYRVAAEIASHNFRYDDATVLAKRAVALDPNNPRVLGDLGTHLLRTGEEADARDVLERAFSADAFNPVTKNLLVMMDALDKFVTLRDDKVIMRLHPDEAPVLGEDAVALAHQALDTVSRRYEFTPKGPILIEMFPKHDDFAVRTAGLPGMVGALGVCFGRVVTLDSPRARPGEFHWEATLWHELAHVVTLQMSNYRVPRWLTEGISGYEEKLQRAEWGRGMEMEFATLLNRGETVKLRDLNAAFTNPRTIAVAYFQSSLVVEHLVGAYGEAGLRRLLRAYGEGLDTEAALKSALDTDFARLQVGFDQTMARMFSTLRVALELPEKGTEITKMPLDVLRAYAAQRPGNYAAQLVLGGALKEAGELDQALQVLERAAALAPMATGDGSPNDLIADIALQRKDTARAIAALEAAVRADFNNVGLARKAAALMKTGGVTDPARTGPVYRRIVAIDPFDGDARASLGRVAMQQNQPAEAVRQFKAVVALGPVDQAAAFTDLAESYFRSGRLADARRQTLAALEIAPSYPRAQDLLLTIAEKRP